MKKTAITFFLISSLIFSPHLKADASSDEGDNGDVQTEQYQGQSNLSDETDEGTSVSQASNDADRSIKKKRWQNIALAAGAVVVAITAMILVANNDGRKGK